MPEINVIPLATIVHSNISDDKLLAIFTFTTPSGEEVNFALPIPQVIPLIELAMIELRKSDMGADVAALEADTWRVESTRDPERFALAFENPNGGRMAFALPKTELPKLQEALRAVETLSKL